MKALKQGLSALVNDRGDDWDLSLPAVALAYNSTPDVATGYSPFFLTKGREATLPVQRFLDEPVLDPVLLMGLRRLWVERVSVRASQIQEEQRRNEIGLLIKVRIGSSRICTTFFAT